MSSRNIVVVGAGPVGTVAALACARLGHRVTLLEAEQRVNDAPRASTTQPPTLEIIEALGLIDEYIARGLVAPTFQFWDRPSMRLVAEFDFGCLKDETRYPYVVQTEQHKLALMGIERLKAMGQAVRMGTRVTGLSQDADSVTVETEQGPLRADYVIGCDGGRSTVRKSLGIEFEGFTWPERFLVITTQFDFAAALHGLGKRWECETISLKPYPCAHVLHSFIDAILALRAEGLRASDVARIRCPIAEHMIGIVCEPREQKIAPQNDWQGRGSLPYSLAEALVTGRLDGTSYRGDAATRGEIRALAAKIEYEVDRSAKPNQFKGWVIAELNEGRVLEKIEPYNRGSAERPLRDFDILKKFRDNAGARFDEARIADIETAVKSLTGPGAVRRLGAACSI